MAVVPDTVTLTAEAAGGTVVVSAAFEMRPTGPEIKEAVVGIVGVSEVRDTESLRPLPSSANPRALVRVGR
jgi:hypothetical protein